MGQSDCCTINYSSELNDKPSVFFDQKLSFNPYNIYMNGELSIMYLLNQNTLIAKEPTVKCDIIDAKNALKLHESDVHYLYKPSNITETEQFYKMIYKLPNDYEIPLNLNFTFTEYCFGNKWSLIWNGSKWTGNNCQGRSNGKIINKCNKRLNKNDYGAAGCYVMCKNDEWNKKFLTDGGMGLMRALFSEGNAKTKILYKDGTIADGRTQRLEIDRAKGIDCYSSDGYDYLPLTCSMENYESNKDILNKVDKLYLDMNIANCLNRLTFRIDGAHVNQHYGADIDLVGELDTVEKVNYVWGASTIDESTKNIELYLNKEYVDPIDEVNWDRSTNPFKYIINNQFYEITPNPNAATTLYTDFNITSSKIITADNITTMRSDLNMVSNSVDVMSYDMNEITNKVEVLNSEIVEQQGKTQYLEKEVGKVKVMAGVALAFGVAGTAMGGASLGMQLTSSGVQFATKNGYSMLSSCSAEAADGYEMFVEGVQIFEVASPISLRSITTDISPVLEWCNSNYTPFVDIPYEDEADNPKTTATSLYTTLDICNRFRDSLKPLLKLLGNRVNEVAEEVNSFDITDQLQNYINKNELVREDVIDVIGKVDNGKVILEPEDVIVSGLIVFKLYIGNLQRRFYITIENKEIIDYKGIQEEIELKGTIFKPLARSEDDRKVYLPNAVIEGKNIEIQIVGNYKVSAGIVEYNDCVRQMSFTTNDLAYISDIDALNRKIDALADISHTNDGVMTLAMDNAMDRLRLCTNFAVRDLNLNQYEEIQYYAIYIKP